MKTNNLAEFLKVKRVECGLTQMEVAEKLGYTSPQFVSNWERGLAHPPVGVLRNLTKMYRVPEKQMFSMLVTDVETQLRTEFFGSRRKH